MDSVYLCRSGKDAFKMNPNLYRDVKNMYVSGSKQSEICEKHNLKQWQVTGIINKIVANHKADHKVDRIKQAEIMEATIFKMIKNKEDISGYINQFSSFCA